MRNGGFSWWRGLFRRAPVIRPQSPREPLQFTAALSLLITSVTQNVFGAFLSLLEKGQVRLNDLHLCAVPNIHHFNYTPPAIITLHASAAACTYASGAGAFFCSYAASVLTHVMICSRLIWLQLARYQPSELQPQRRLSVSAHAQRAASVDYGNSAWKRSAWKPSVL